MTSSYLHPGKQLGTRYQLEELIGSGQFGQVWRAKSLNPPSSKPVAIKLPLNPGRGEETLMADAQHMLDIPPHPGIVSINWQGRVGAVWVVEMEFVNGKALSEIMADYARWAQVTFKDMIEWFIGVAESLDYLHGKRILHGDIKPDNLLLDESSNRLKLTDFGTSRRLTDNLLKTTRHGGAWAYQAPEIQQFNERGIPSDLFSVGAVLYHMMTGRLPRATIHELLTSAPIVRPRQYNQDIPEGLESIVMSLLEDAPRARLQTAYVLLEQLQQISGTLKGGLPNPTALEMGTGYLDQARAFLKEKRLEEARRAAAKASLHSTGLASALELFARLSDKLGYTDDAIAAYKKLLSLDYIGLEARRSIILALSDLLLRLRKFEEAKIYIEESLHDGSQSYSLRFRAAIVLGACGKLQEAFNMLEALEGEFQNNDAVLEKKAWVLWLMHRYEEAAEVCRAVLEIMPESNVCLKLLVEYETLLGNKRRAEVYQKRLEIIF